MEYLAGLGNQIIANAPQLVGFIMPWIVEVFNRDITNERHKTIVAVSLCLFAAILLHWNEIAYGTPEQVFTYAGVIFMESQATYMLYFKGSGIQSRVQRIVKSKNYDPPITPSDIQ